MQGGSHKWRRDDVCVDIPEYTEPLIEDLGIEK